MPSLELPLEMPSLELPPPAVQPELSPSVGKKSILREMVVNYGEIPSAEDMREELPPWTWAGKHILEFVTQGQQSVDKLISSDIPAGKRQRMASQTEDSQNGYHKLCERLRSGSS